MDVRLSYFPTKILRGLIPVFALIGSIQAAHAQQPIELKKAPAAFVGGPWLNTPQNKPITLASRIGKVTVVEFWNFGCINCRRNLPSYARWQKRFAPNDVAVIGIHTPETDGERSPAKVMQRGVERPGHHLSDPARPERDELEPLGSAVLADRLSPRQARTDPLSLGWRTRI